MINIYQSSGKYNLPNGYTLERDNAPLPSALNHLFSRCNQFTYSKNKLLLALERSFFILCIYQKKAGTLSGFIRATTDNGLNANLWNLAVEPGEDHSKLVSILLNRSLLILRREVPGSSISVSAPLSTINALKEQGFLIDPGGIRAMGLRL